MPKKKKPRWRTTHPADATAWCALHHRLMNDVYIRRRGCVARICKHLVWLKDNAGASPPGSGGRK